MEIEKLKRLAIMFIHEGQIDLSFSAQTSKQELALRQQSARHSS